MTNKKNSKTNKPTFVKGGKSNASSSKTDTRSVGFDNIDKAEHSGNKGPKSGYKGNHGKRYNKSKGAQNGKTI